MFFYPIWVLGGGGGVSPKGPVHNLLMLFFTLGSSKIEVSETFFFHIVTDASHVKHVLGSIYVFFHGYWVCVCVFFGCALLGVDSLPGGLAKANRFFF